MAIVRWQRALAAGFATGVFLFGGSVFASESTNWLIENPVSMMDWGSAKAEKAAESAASSLNSQMDARAKQDSDFEYDKSIPQEVIKQTLEDRKRWTTLYPSQYGYHYGPGFAGYDMPRDRFLVGVFAIPDNKVLHPGKIDAESCSGIIEDFRKQLLNTAKSPEQLVADFWFSHNGYKSNHMPANFEKDLIQHTTIVVHLHRYVALESAVTCEQSISGGAITSVVKKSAD